MSRKAFSFLALVLLFPACSDSADAESAGVDAATSGETPMSETDGEGPGSGTDESTGGGTEDPEVPDTDPGESSSGPSGSGGETELTFEEYLDARNMERCRDSVACGRIPDMSYCAAIELGFGPDRRAVEMGELVFDGVAAANCINVWRDQTPSCRSIFAPPTPNPAEEMALAELAEACDPVLVGVVPVGEPCHHEDACDSEPVATSCEGFAHEYQCKPGVCAPLPTPGKEGELCSPFGSEADVACVDGLHCPVEGLMEGGMSTCHPKEDTGGACSGHDGCLSGLCVDGSCAHVAEPGEACTPLDGELSSLCALNMEYCDPVTSACTPDAEIGAPCDAETVCVGYGFCDNGTCTQAGDAGDPCDPEASGSCFGLRYCDSKTSTCVDIEFPTCE